MCRHEDGLVVFNATNCFTLERVQREWICLVKREKGNKKGKRRETKEKENRYREKKEGKEKTEREIRERKDRGENFMLHKLC